MAFNNVEIMYEAAFPYFLPILFAPIFLVEIKKWIKISRAKCLSLRMAVLIYFIVCTVFVGLIAHHFSGHLFFLALPVYIFVIALVAMAIIDAFTGYLPNSLTISLLFLGIGLHIAGKWYFSELPFYEPIASITGATIGYVGFYFANLIHVNLKGFDGLGMGDAKLVAAIGAWFGPMNLLYVVGIASACSLLLPLLRWALKKEQKNGVPFGPYLAIGAILSLLM